MIWTCIVLTFGIYLGQEFKIPSVRYIAEIVTTYIAQTRSTDNSQSAVETDTTGQNKIGLLLTTAWTEFLKAIGRKNE